MGWPSFDAWRALGTPAARLSYDDFSALMQGYLSVEHAADGSHTEIHADSIETGPLAIVLPVGPLETALAFYRENPAHNKIAVGTISPNASGVLVLTFTEIDLTGMANFGAVAGASGAEQQMYNALTVLARLRLFGQSTYAPSAGDVDALNDGANNPVYSYYTLTGTLNRVIEGMHAELTNGNAARGQLVITPYTGSGSQGFNSSIVVNARKILTPTFLTPGQTAMWVSELAGLGWRCIGVSGQQMVDIAFAAGNFTGNGAMTWTLTSPDQSNFSASLDGNMMTVCFSLNTTSVGGTPDTDLQIKIPFGLVSSRNVHNMVYAKDNGTFAPAFAHVEVAGTVIGIQLATPGNWAAAANTTQVNGQISFSVQAP